MNLGTQLKIAMINNGIRGAKQLSELTGLNYALTIRLLNNEPSAKLKDAVTTAKALGLKLTFTIVGEE